MKRIYISLIVFLSVQIANAQWTQTGTMTAGQGSAMASSGSNLYSGSGLGGGIHVSTDNGSNWTSIGGSTISTTYSIAANGSDLYIGNQYGVYITSDNGANWTSKTNGLDGSNLTTTALTIVGTKIYAGTAAGLYSSTDKGANWSLVSTNMKEYVRSFVFIGNSIFVGTYNKGVFMSSDNGSTWTQVNTTGIKTKCTKQTKV